MPRKIPTGHKHEPPGERPTPLVEVIDKPEACLNGDRIATIERQLSEAVALIMTLADRVASLEKRTAQAPVTANDPVPVPRAVSDLCHKVIAIEERLATVSDASEMEEMAQSISDIGTSALTNLSMIMKRMQALETRISNLPAELMIEVGAAQIDLKRRA